MFRPLAFTKTFAMVAAALLSITLVPVLMALLHSRQEAAGPNRRIRSRGSFTALYAPVLRLALRWQAGRPSS